MVVIKPAVFLDQRPAHLGHASPWEGHVFYKHSTVLTLHTVVSHYLAHGRNASTILYTYTDIPQLLQSKCKTLHQKFYLISKTSL